MRPPMALALCLAVGSMIAGPARAQPAADAVDLVPIVSRTFAGGFVNPWLPDPLSGTPVSIHGILRMPAGSGRVPAVVLLHGCGGVGESETEWARWLRELGYATLIVNSFTGRGIASVCRGTQVLNAASSLSDALAALQALAVDPRIDPARIAVFGVSFGGRAALWTSHRRLRERYRSGPASFAAHFALYPASCLIRLADVPDREASIRILHGTADDWTPIGACIDEVSRWRNAGVDAEIISYADAGHGFDLRRFAATVHVSGAVNLAGCSFAEREGAIVDADGRAASYESPCVRRTSSLAYHPQAHAAARADLARLLDELVRRRVAPR